MTALLSKEILIVWRGKSRLLGAFVFAAAMHVRDVDKDSERNDRARSSQP